VWLKSRERQIFQHSAFADFAKAGRRSTRVTLHRRRDTAARRFDDRRNMDDAEEKVVLRVYDLSNGMARAMSQQFLGIQVDIVPHTGVFVYGREWFFSGGIQSAPSWGMMPVHEEIVLGQTGVPLEIFAEFLDGIRDQYTADTYNLVTNNCNHFSNAVAEFLAGVQVPAS